MLRVRVMAAGVIGLSFFAVGCGAAPSDGGEEILVTEQEIIVMNGLSPAHFWDPSTQHALRALAQAKLGDAIAGPAGAALLSSAQGEALLGRVVACALPEGTTVQTAAQVSLGGAVGLAPQWASAPLSDVASRRWLTACLLQSLNGLGAHVPILLSGSHPALGNDPEGEASEFTVEDATMFGDLFDPTRPAAFACADTMPADDCGPSWSDHTLQRICGQSPACGLTLLGHCGAVCTRDSAGAPTCSAVAGEVYPESIASRLELSDAVSLGRECDASAEPAAMPSPAAP